jgi:hypothetical protein
MELRSSAGVFDRVSATDPSVTGVSVRAAGDYTGAATRLVDATPATATMIDAPWQPGQRFDDPVSGVSIAVLSVALGSASVHVTVPGTESLDQPSAVAPATRPTALARLRRVSTHRGLLRVVVPVAGGTRRCSTRVGGQSSSCRVRSGRVVIVKNLDLRRQVIPVSLDVDGIRVFTVRLRVPKVGESTQVTTQLPRR